MGKRKVGILGGSYNPVHNGHLMLASYIAQFGPFDEVWLVLSPCNPFKANKEMASDSDRLTMLTLGMGQSKVLKVCDIELRLPRPSYTITTLDCLSKKYADCEFTPIIGADNLVGFAHWKDSDDILSKYGLCVYPRPGYTLPANLDERIHIIDAPEIELSSTFVRQSIASGRDMNFFIPESVYQYIKDKKLYVEKDSCL